MRESKNDDGEANHLERLWIIPSSPGDDEIGGDTQGRLEG